ncbi:MAG: NAD-dependent epimerase/dehydratase family protein [Desulfotignum sp.]|nr:NAD-dependent epimerase/dehydratase family protein [Desulfotignum sp.]
MAEFIYENLVVQANAIHAAHRSGVQKLLFLGSSCICPREVPQPMKEEALSPATIKPKTWFALVKKYIYNMPNTKIKNEQY